MEAAVDPSISIPVSITTTLTIKGVLWNASGRYPLSGLHVSAYYLEPESEPQQSGGGFTPRPVETLLGEGISSFDGSFGIVFRKSPQVAQRLCLLTQCPDAACILKVSDRSGPVYLVSGRLSGPRHALFVELGVPIPTEEISSSLWRQLGSRLLAARVAHLEELVRQLVLVPSGQSLFADWSMVKRHSVLGALEAAFLDPRGILRKLLPLPRWHDLVAPGALDKYQRGLHAHLEQDALAQTALRELLGKVMRFPDLASVDWVIDPRPFLAGDAGGALTRFQEQYRVIGPGIVPGIAQGPSDLGRYRDYLREIFIDSITQVEGEQESKLTHEQALAQLQTRFHQDFTTIDTTQVGVNELLIPIVVSILTAGSGGKFGFGLAAAALPPRNGATAREYLDRLIALSGLSAQQLGLRYRLDLERPDTTLSSAVAENIFTLKSFFRDGFQCGIEPFHAEPDILHQPIVPDVLQGKAPFFLEFTEWLRKQKPIAFENFFQIREIFKLSLGSESREALKQFAKSAPLGERPAWQLYVDCLCLHDLLQKGYEALDHNDFTQALSCFEQVAAAAVSHLQNPLLKGRDLRQGFADCKSTPIKSLSDLSKYMSRYQILDRAPHDDWVEWRDFYLDRLPYALVYLLVYVLPTCIGDAALGMGDYPMATLAYGQTTRFFVAQAAASDAGGYRPYYLDDWGGSRSYFRLYHTGNLPYTVNLEKKKPQGYPAADDDDAYHFARAGCPSPAELHSEQLVESLTHPVEVQYFRLRQGNAMLEWADALYRSDDPSNIARARELYKGVLFLHGRQPQIAPDWHDWPEREKRAKPGSESRTESQTGERSCAPIGCGHFGQLGLSPIHFINGYENPAKTSQASRGWLGFTSIDGDLNYFGYSQAMLPTLHYQALKDAADRANAQARSAQQDFLDYLVKAESANIENIKNAAMLQKVRVFSQLAAEQAERAQELLAQAQLQVERITAAITKAEQDLACSNRLQEKWSDYLSVLSNRKKALPDLESSTFAKSAAGYITISSLADAARLQKRDLKTLAEDSLAAARIQLAAAQHAVTIAGLKQQIAHSDADLAHDLLTFQTERFRNIEFCPGKGRLRRQTSSRPRRVIH